jgi:hypothetical protein
MPLFSVVESKVEDGKVFVFTLKPRAFGVKINCNIRGHGEAKAAEM